MLGLALQATLRRLRRQVHRPGWIWMFDLRALPLKSEEAATLAARLVGAYQSGIHDAEGLTAAAEGM
ncbi:hypothetical protein GOC18_24780 [Sinorhizobium meliloti]|nr:hypothetical protein [Sinorhizobium meliloti]